MPTIAVLTFPGNNCEVETLRAIKKTGLSAEIFLWNQNPEDLKKFDGVVVPGGFSFEDRGRSGIIAAQEEVLQTLKEMGKNGMPILGICNGAQILVESGLILETPEKIPMLSLSRNKRKNKAGEVLGTGFYHSWRNLLVKNKNTPFSHFDQNFRIPLAHGEGRFVFPKEIEQEIIEKNLIIFQYTHQNGIIDEHYPVNPNGSFLNAAAVCNPAGNVVAMMPHPERTEIGKCVFESLKHYFDHSHPLNNQKNINFSFGKREKKESKKADIEFFVQLKITDKTEKTFEHVVQQKWDAGAKLTRRIKWSLSFEETISETEKKERAKIIITSNELLNINKESALVRIENTFFHFSAGELSKITPNFAPENSFEVQENEDFKGESKKLHFAHLFPEWKISTVSHGTFWTLEHCNIEQIIPSPLFANFVGEKVIQYSV